MFTLFFLQKTKVYWYFKSQKHATPKNKCIVNPKKFQKILQIVYTVKIRPVDLLQYECIKIRIEKILYYFLLYS